MPKLILKFEAAVIKEMPFLTNTLSIGRKPDNDLVIDHPAVSGNHCRISLQSGTYFIEDLNSTNGTLVNDKKIIKSGIHNNDVIAIAKHTLIFVDDRPNQAVAKAEEASVPVSAEAAPPVSQAQIPTGAPTPSGSPAAPESTSDDLGLAPLPKKGFDKIGGLRVIEGGLDPLGDYILKENSTYIGKSDRANIKIKGGMMAPDLAVLVSRKTDGFVLVAIKEGYPKVNGMSVAKEQRLNEGDQIEVGSTKFQFYLKPPV